MQFSLNAFDPAAKKIKFKIVIVDGNSKKIFFQDAFSEDEIRSLYPDATQIKALSINKNNACIEKAATHS